MTAVRGFTDVSTIDEQEHRITAGPMSYRMTGAFIRTLDKVNSLGFVTLYRRKLVFSERTMDDIRIAGYLRMIDDEDCPLEYADVELSCHEYVDKYCK